MCIVLTTSYTQCPASHSTSIATFVDEQAIYCPDQFFKEEIVEGMCPNCTKLREMETANSLVPQNASARSYSESLLGLLGAGLKMKTEISSVRVENQKPDSPGSARTMRFIGRAAQTSEDQKEAPVVGVITVHAQKLRNDSAAELGEENDTDCQSKHKAVSIKAGRDVQRDTIKCVKIARDKLRTQRLGLADH